MTSLHCNRAVDQSTTRPPLKNCIHELYPPRTEHRDYPYLTLAQTGAVVMAMRSAPASARGVVAMEIPVRGSLAVVEEDDGVGAPPPGSEPEHHQHRGERQPRGPLFDQRKYYMLVVIGEISTDHQLNAARDHIERGGCFQLFFKLANVTTLFKYVDQRMM